MRILKKKARGFTLAELLVVMAIITIVTSVVVFSFQSGREKKELEASARVFGAMIREAQNYALTGKQAVPNTTPCRYEVEWSGTSYSLRYWEKTNDICSFYSVIATGELSRGASYASSSSFYYTLPHAVPSFGTDGTQSIVVTKGGSSRYICVYGQGRVTEQENPC